MSEAEKDAFSAIKETKAHLHAQAAYTEQDLRQRLIDEGCSCDVLCGYYCGFHKALANYEARIRSEARAGMREACAEVAEALALKLCWHCAEHVKNGYKFMGYGHTEVDLDSGDARQIYAAVGTGENWSHLIRTESGLEWPEKCKAWMLWSIVYGTPDPAADEAIERICEEAHEAALPLAAEQIIGALTDGGEFAEGSPLAKVMQAIERQITIERDLRDEHWTRALGFTGILTPNVAALKIGSVKAAARMEEANLWREHSVWEGSIEWADKRCAGLSGKET